MLTTPQHCKAARILLKLSPEMLAGYSGVSTDMVVSYEEQLTDVPRSIIESIHVALEYAGIQFLKIDDDALCIVRLRSNNSANSTSQLLSDKTLNSNYPDQHLWDNS